jgi:hypothetical protein
MATFTRFEDLDDERFFIDFVDGYYAGGWARITNQAGTRLVTDRDRVQLAFQTYQLSLQQYQVALKSQNPDHYKRSGALLHALYKSSPIVEVAWDEGVERLRDFENVGVSYDDAQHWDNFIDWHDQYANEAMAFDIAFRCCQVYEERPRP